MPRHIIILLFILNYTFLHADEVKSNVSVYFWLPSINASGNFVLPPDDGSADEPFPIDASEILDAIDFVLMGSYEARYEKFLFFTDIVYLDMSSTQSINILNTSRDVEIGFEGWQSSYYGGYNLINSDDLLLDVIGGIRYFSIEFEIEVDKLLLTNRKRTFYEGLLDGVVGLKGQYNITPQWFVPYHADVGVGQSDLTYQLISGIGYSADWGDVSLTYRHLSWHMGDDGVLNTFTLSGSSIAYTYHF